MSRMLYSNPDQNAFVDVAFAIRIIIEIRRQMAFCIFPSRWGLTLSPLDTMRNWKYERGEK